MMSKVFTRREDIGTGRRAPRRIERLEADPTDCIVCVAHTVCFMAFLGIVAELFCSVTGAT
jgi:hypothetical protein